jgi:hypothetical protein
LNFAKDFPFLNLHRKKNYAAIKDTVLGVITVCREMNLYKILLKKFESFFAGRQDLWAHFIHHN